MQLLITNTQTHLVETYDTLSCVPAKHRRVFGLLVEGDEQSLTCEGLRYEIQTSSDRYETN